MFPKNTIKTKQKCVLHENIIKEMYVEQSTSLPVSVNTEKWPQVQMYKHFKKKN